MSYEQEARNRSLEPELQTVGDFFRSLEPTVKGMDDLQRQKTLADNTRIIVNHYQSVENGGSPEEFETFATNVYKEDCGGIIFTVTKNGLVTVEINKKMVSLRSHLFPRPGENLQVTYDNDDSSKTPLEVFRQAAKPLVAWLGEIKARDQWISPPVVISEKALVK